MQKIIEELNIDEEFTKNRYTKETVFNSIKNSIRHEPNYNHMADLLFLPTTDEGYKYLLIIVDLYTDLFDAEALKAKTSEDVSNAMKKIYKRQKYLKQPIGSLQTDSGTEFKGVFHKYLFEQNILHTQTLPGRHRQQSSVESLNRVIGRLLNGYMNSIEIDTEETYCEWTDILSEVIKKLNAYRKKKRGSIALNKNPYISNDDYKVPDTLAKFKIGDIVHQRLDRPENALGHLQSTENFRAGDFRWSTVPKKIIKVLVFNDEPRYRYMLKGIKNASFTDSELMISSHEEEKQKVKSIIGRRKIGRKIEYLVWFKGELKSESSWEPRTNLIEDGLEKLLERYDTEHN